MPIDARDCRTGAWGVAPAAGTDTACTASPGRWYRPLAYAKNGHHEPRNSVRHWAFLGEPGHGNEGDRNTDKQQRGAVMSWAVVTFFPRIYRSDY